MSIIRNAAELVESLMRFEAARFVLGHHTAQAPCKILAMAEGVDSPAIILGKYAELLHCSITEHEKEYGNSCPLPVVPVIELLPVIWVTHKTGTGNTVLSLTGHHSWTRLGRAMFQIQDTTGKRGVFTGPVDDYTTERDALLSLLTGAEHRSSHDMDALQNRASGFFLTEEGGGTCPPEWTPFFRDLLGMYWDGE